MSERGRQAKGVKPHVKAQHLKSFPQYKNYLIAGEKKLPIKVMNMGGNPNVSAFQNRKN